MKEIATLRRALELSGRKKAPGLCVGETWANLVASGRFNVRIQRRFR